MFEVEYEIYRNTKNKINFDERKENAVEIVETWWTLMNNEILLILKNDLTVTVSATLTRKIICAMFRNAFSIPETINMSDNTNLNLKEV